MTEHMTTAAIVATDQSPTSPEWPSAIACPYIPRGRHKEWAVFEEKYPPPGYGPRRVHLSDHQIENGMFGPALQMRADWLATHFPAPGGGLDQWDWPSAAAWLRQQIELSDQRWRSNRRTWRGPDLALPAPRPEAPRVTPPQSWRHEGPARDATRDQIRTLTLIREPDGRRILAITVALRDDTDLRALRLTLTPAEALALSDTLRG